MILLVAGISYARHYIPKPACSSRLAYISLEKRSNLSQSDHCSISPSAQPPPDSDSASDAGFCSMSASVLAVDSGFMRASASEAGSRSVRASVSAVALVLMGA